VNIGSITIPKKESDVSTKSISESLASYLEKISFNKIPSTTISKVKLCILDFFGSYFAGHNLKDCDPIKKYILSLKSEKQATVWSLGLRTFFTEAAFANSAISHVTVFDDMHGNTSSHYGSMVIPTAFAIGEYLGECSGKELITGIVCGYETGIRIGTAMMPTKFTESGFRPSGTFGVFGSAVTTGKLLGFKQDKIINTLGLAANFGTGLMAFVMEGTIDLIYHNGFAARNGILSAILVNNGTKSCRCIFESDGGFCKTYGANLENAKLIIDDMNYNFKIEEVYFKQIPACAFVQSAAMAALEIAKNRDFKIEDIYKVKVDIFNLGKNYPGLDCQGPFGGIMQAQMSNPFTIASIFINKSINFDCYQDFENNAVQKLSKKIEIFEDEEAEKRWPLEQVVKIEVYLKDGSSRKAISRNPHFLDDDEVFTKCRKYLTPILGYDVCEEFIETILNLEKLSNIKKVSKIISKALPGLN